MLLANSNLPCLNGKSDIFGSNLILKLPSIQLKVFLLKKLGFIRFSSQEMPNVFGIAINEIIFLKKHEIFQAIFSILCYGTKLKVIQKQFSERDPIYLYNIFTNNIFTQYYNALLSNSSGIHSHFIGTCHTYDSKLKKIYFAKKQLITKFNTYFYAVSLHEI